MRAHVIILGCGFGGLFAARALRGAPLDVTIVDRVNHHLFQPLRYQVATAGLSAPAIAAPIRHILAGQKNVTVLLGEAQRIDASRRAVVLEDGAELVYFLINFRNRLVVMIDWAWSYWTFQRFARIVFGPAPPPD